MLCVVPGWKLAGSWKAEASAKREAARGTATAFFFPLF
jgi:hypothetical protein